jgi:hypothetical protein
MHLKAADLDTMFPRDVLDLRHALDDLHQLLGAILLLVQLLHVRCPELLVQRNRCRRDDALEPGCDRGDKRDREVFFARQPPEMPTRFAFVDVVRQGVGPDPSSQCLGRDLGTLPRRCPRTAVPAHSKNRRCRLDVRQQRREQELGVGRIAAGIGNSLGLSDS